MPRLFTYFYNTRKEYLLSQGIEVSPDEEIPENVLRKNDANRRYSIYYGLQENVPSRDKLYNFLQFDRKVLRLIIRNKTPSVNFITIDSSNCDFSTIDFTRYGKMQKTNSPKRNITKFTTIWSMIPSKLDNWWNVTCTITRLTDS